MRPTEQADLALRVGIGVLRKAAERTSKSRDISCFPQSKHLPERG